MKGHLGQSGESSGRSARVRRGKARLVRRKSGGGRRSSSATAAPRAPRLSIVATARAWGEARAGGRGLVGAAAGSGPWRGLAALAWRLLRCLASTPSRVGRGRPAHRVPRPGCAARRSACGSSTRLTTWCSRIGGATDVRTRCVRYRRRRDVARRAQWTGRCSTARRTATSPPCAPEVADVEPIGVTTGCSGLSGEPGYDVAGWAVRAGRRSARIASGEGVLFSGPRGAGCVLHCVCIGDRRDAGRAPGAGGGSRDADRCSSVSPLLHSSLPPRRSTPTGRARR